MYIQSGLIFFFILSTLLYITFLFPSWGGWSYFSGGLIKPNARLAVQETKILPSLLATNNGISSVHLLSGCIIYKLQDPIILAFLLVYIPNCKSLGTILAQSGFLNKYLYMLTGIIFTLHMSQFWLAGTWFCSCVA